MPTTLLSLPTELLLHILSFLPDLHLTSTPTTIGPNIPLTPSICRASHTLRREARLLHASSKPFVIQADEEGTRVRAWTAALGDEALAKVTSLQLSRHWRVPRPERGEGHVGFYLRLQRLGSDSSGWSCARGTYPVVDDTRGLRAESVFVLREVVVRYLQRRGGQKGWGLSRRDVEFVLAAMEIVADHAIGTYDVDQSGEGRRARRRVFERMEGMLRELEGEGEGRESGMMFFTPY